MITFVFIIGIWLFLNGIYQLIKYSYITSGFSITQINTINVDNTNHHKFIILIPVLHEEKNIINFINEIANQNYPLESFELYIITSEKEYLYDNKPNTIDIINQIQFSLNFPNLNIQILHYPYSTGFKADQLNYAFQHIKRAKTVTDISKIFFITFDADSQINKNTLAIINKTIIQNVDIYQMPLFWTKNISQIESKLMISFSFLQSYFSIAYEIPMITDKFYPWRLKYLLGHGLCLRGTFLLRINNYPSLIEDVRLGRLISYLNIKVMLVPIFGMVETAKSISIYIKQSSVWFFGCGLFISDYYLSKYYCHSSKLSSRNILLILYGFYKFFRWLNKGLFHLSGLLYSIIYSSDLLLVLFSLSLIINSIIPVHFITKDYLQFWGKEVNIITKMSIIRRAINYAPIFYIFNFIGLYYGFYKICKFYVCKTVNLPKTER